MTADKIVALLRQKHSSDVFVDECKTGSSWFSYSCPRLDAWAMEKSWAHPLTIGYEIKVSRSDFLGDNKWHLYLDYCNEFYFVCPQGIINPSEVGESAGLMWVSKNCARVYVKKKAPYRDIEIPESLWRYILISRASIVGEYRPCSKKEFWDEWLKHKNINRELGRHVNGALGKRIEKEILAVSEENERLLAMIEKLKDVKAFLDKYKISYGITWGFEERVLKINEQIKNGISPEIIKNLKLMSEYLSHKAIEVERIINQETEGNETK